MLTTTLLRSRASPHARSLPATPPVRIHRVDAIALEMPLRATVHTPVARFSSVVNLLVRVEDDDGTAGWGEVWCNFPRFGVHHRARLLREIVAPLLVGRAFATPAECLTFLAEATRIVRLQAGEPGPFAAVLAGVDIALWDIAGKKLGAPLWHLFGGARGDVPIYVSVGWAPDAMERVQRHADQGVRAFKLRSAGDTAAHLAVALAARDVLGNECELMLDLNSSWDETAALAGVPALAPARLSWLEEPLPVDAPDAAWTRLANAAPMPIAGGENMIDAGVIDDALALGALAVVQPDMTKWGGFSQQFPLARRIVAAGRRYCPHMFGGPVGTLAAAHLLASSNAPGGMLEWGVNHHPVRDAMMPRDVRGGIFHLDDTPGLGLRVDEAVLRQFRIEA